MAAYLELDCYPEVPAALDQLKARNMRTAILSNGTPKMLQAAVANSDLGNRLDEVLSVEAVKVYKPDPRVYQLALDSLQLPAEAIVFLSSNAWDAAGAAAFGLRVAWVNRFTAAAGAPAGPARPGNRLPGGAARSAERLMPARRTVSPACPTARPPPPKGDSLWPPKPSRQWS